MGQRESPERSSMKDEPAAPPSSPKPAVFTLKNIALVIGGVVVSSLFAIFAVGNFIAPAIEGHRASQPSQAGFDKSDSNLENLVFFSIDPLIVNPANSNGERYLKAAISLEMHDPDLLNELNKRLPQIKNQINNILSSKTIGQIQTNEDRERLRREIQNRVNGLLVGGYISNVYFEEFVYQ
jgi:flagellar FliL protein